MIIKVNDCISLEKFKMRRCLTKTLTIEGLNKILVAVILLFAFCGFILKLLHVLPVKQSIIASRLCIIYKVNTFKYGMFKNVVNFVNKSLYHT